MATRQQIVTALGLRLAQLTTANGYSRTFDRQDYWDSPSEYAYDYLIYRDTEENYQEDNRLHQAVLQVEIEAIIYGDDSPTAASAVLNDLIKLIGSDRTFGRLALKTEISRVSKVCDTSGKKMCSLMLELAITYRFPIWSPG